MSLSLVGVKRFIKRQAMSLTIITKIMQYSTVKSKILQNTVKSRMDPAVPNTFYLPWLLDWFVWK